MPELEKTEKITINLGLVDLGQIDLLVQEGFYSNRTDFIRMAIRTQLATHMEGVKRTVARKMLVLGVQHYTRHDLEAGGGGGAAGEKGAGLTKKLLVAHKEISSENPHPVRPRLFFFVLFL